MDFNHLVINLLLLLHLHYARAASLISSRDRIYTGDQTSNTVTVADPSSNTVLGTIALGDSRLGDDFNPQYTGTVNAHGLGFSRDGKFIVSLSTLSNTATIIRTEDNSVISQAYVDRGPHEAMFAPDNRTIWIGTRGVSSISIVDAINATVLERIQTGNGPSKVLFSPNGTLAYVNHIMDPVISVIDVRSRTVQYNITGLADIFSSDMMISPNGKSLWAAHKMTGQVSVIDLEARKVISVLESGPETNHPNFAIINGTMHAFVTVGSLNVTKVYSQPTASDQPVFITDIRMTGIEPHGLWPSSDNTRMYVVNEHSDTVDVISTASLEIMSTMRVGQEGQALIFVQDAIPEHSSGLENLSNQGLGLKVENKLIPIAEHDDKRERSAQVSEMQPQALITIRETSGLDMFQVIGRNLVLNQTYTASARCKACGIGTSLPIVTFNASTPSPSGCGTAPQVLAFLEFFDTYDIDSIDVYQSR